MSILHQHSAAMSKSFIQVRIPQQKSYDELLFPEVLSPNPTSAVAHDLFSFLQSIRAEKLYFQKLLHSSGAILLRGFPVGTASAFNDVVESFGFEELPYVGGAAPRTNVVGRVFTANESPPDQKIPFHHEMAQVLRISSYNFTAFLSISILHVLRCWLKEQILLEYIFCYEFCTCAVSFIVPD